MSETNEHAVFVTIGASNHSSANREVNDYYATDPVALELLLEKETFSENVWECACGEGHLSEVLKQHGYNVLSTDLIDRGYGCGGVDFLTDVRQFDGDIITNPPYKYAKEFVEHAIQSVTDGHRVCMFLRLNFLEGKSRRKLFETAPPNTYMFPPRELTAAKTVISAKSAEPTAPLWRMHGLSGEKGFAARQQ